MITGPKRMPILCADSSDTQIQVHRQCHVRIFREFVKHILLFCLDATALYNAYFGQGIIPVLLNDVSCLGSESRLLDCSYDSNTTDCSHSDDAAVRCQTGEIFSSVVLLQYTGCIYPHTQHAPTHVFD